MASLSKKIAERMQQFQRESPSKPKLPKCSLEDYIPEKSKRKLEDAEDVQKGAGLEQPDKPTDEKSLDNMITETDSSDNINEDIPTKRKKIQTQGTEKDTVDDEDNEKDNTVEDNNSDGGLISDVQEASTAEGTSSDIKNKDTDSSENEDNDIPKKRKKIEKPGAGKDLVEKAKKDNKKQGKVSNKKKPSAKGTVSKGRKRNAEKEKEDDEQTVEEEDNTEEQDSTDEEKEPTITVTNIMSKTFVIDLSREVKDYVKELSEKAQSSKPPTAFQIKMLTNEALRQLLKYNDRPICHELGKKDLAAMVLDYMINGCPPRCPKCKRGALRFSNGKKRNGKRYYWCPGSTKDGIHFLNCTFKAQKGELERIPWKCPP